MREFSGGRGVPANEVQRDMSQNHSLKKGLYVAGIVLFGLLSLILLGVDVVFLRILFA